MSLLRKFADCPNCPQAPLVNQVQPAPAPIPPMKVEPPIGAARKAVPAASLAKLADGDMMNIREYGANAGALCKLAAVEVVMEKGPDGSYVDSGKRVERPDVKGPRIEKTMKKGLDGSYVVDEPKPTMQTRSSAGGSRRANRGEESVRAGLKRDFDKAMRDYHETVRRNRAAEKAMRNGMLAAGAIGVPLITYGAYRAFRRDD